MALVAVCLTTYKLMDEKYSENNNGLQTGLRVLWSVINSLGLGGLLLWVSRRIRKIPFLTQPGEWMLVSIGISFVYGIVYWAIIKSATHGDEYEHVSISHWSIWLGVGRGLLLAVLWCIAAVRSKDFRVWRITFWIYALHASFDCVIALILANKFDVTFALRHYWVIVDVVVSVAPAVVQLVALGFDIFKRRTYTWTHWVGAITMTVSMLVIAGLPFSSCGYTFFQLRRFIPFN